VTKLVSITRRVDDPGPLLDRLPARDGVAWVQAGDGLIGAGAALRVDAGAGAGRFDRAREAYAAFLNTVTIDDEVEAPGTGPVALGSFTFADRSVGSVLIVPSVVVGRLGAVSWVTRIGAVDEVTAAFAGDPLPPAMHPEHAPEADHPRHAGSSIPDMRWLEAVAAAVESIEAGDLDKVVLARDVAVWAEAQFDTRVLARRLHDRFPGCSTFIVDGLVGATPELFVDLTGRHLTSTSLAGTAPRADDPAEDAALGAALLASAKDRHEHQLLVDEVVAALRRRGMEPSHGREPHLLRLDNLQHLATRFVAELREDDDATSLDLAAFLHPTPAVGGVPTHAALALIDELEQMDRGRYAGPIGWMDPRGDGQWGIALRCAEVEGARARLFAGAGIVADSLPEAELEETRVKLRAMRSAFGG
jgi:menaquinone-specific isochorismate synthase